MFRCLLQMLFICVIGATWGCSDQAFKGAGSGEKKGNNASDASNSATRSNHIKGSDIDVTGKDTNGGTIGSSQGSESPCANGIVEDKTALFQTPTSGSYGWGHNHRDDYSPNSDKDVLINFVNEKCQAGLTATGVNAGVLATDKKTRDAVCQLYGYLEATDNFTYWYFNSPDNNRIAFYDGSKFTEIYGAENFNGGQLLSKAECRGKVKDKCTGMILNVKNLKCRPI